MYGILIFHKHIYLSFTTIFKYKPFEPVIFQLACQLLPKLYS